MTIVVFGAFEMAGNRSHHLAQRGFQILSGHESGGIVDAFDPAWACHGLRFSLRRDLIDRNRGCFLLDHSIFEPQHHLREFERRFMSHLNGRRMTAAKKRAAKRKGGKGPVRKRTAGKGIMKT